MNPGYMTILRSGGWMIAGIGSDICEVDRFVRIVRRATARYYEMLLSDEEMRAFARIRTERARAEWLAGVFAAKEAVLKACGTGIDGRIPPSSICTLGDGQRHSLKLPPAMVAMLGGEIVSHLTIVHTKQVAIACVVLERHRTGTPLSWEKEWK